MSTEPAATTGPTPDGNDIDNKLKCFYSISDGPNSIVKFQLRESLDTLKSKDLGPLPEYNRCGSFSHCKNPIPCRFYRCTNCSQVMCKSCFKAQERAGWHLKPDVKTQFLLDQDEYFAKRYALSSTILIKIDSPVREEIGKVMDRVESKAEEVLGKYESFRRSLETRMAQLRNEQRMKGDGGECGEGGEAEAGGV